MTNIPPICCCDEPIAACAALFDQCGCEGPQTPDFAWVALPLDCCMEGCERFPHYEINASSVGKLFLLKDGSASQSCYTLSGLVDRIDVPPEYVQMFPLLDIGHLRGPLDSEGIADCLQCCDVHTTGACCHDTGSPSCTISTERQCEGSPRGGEWQGPDTNCGGGGGCPAQIDGACCLPFDLCDFTSETACDFAGGDYQGDGVPCESDTCDFTGGCNECDTGECGGTRSLTVSGGQVTYAGDSSCCCDCVAGGVARTLSRDGCDELSLNNSEIAVLCDRCSDCSRTSQRTSEFNPVRCRADGLWGLDTYAQDADGQSSRYYISWSKGGNCNTGTYVVDIIQCLSGPVPQGCCAEFPYQCGNETCPITNVAPIEVTG